ncbi:MAG: cobalamin-dependent protein, partial [Desulfobacterales bacterium]|nr:cobalamin-dependent protein [Desulfobacterales bacterium]
MKVLLISANTVLVPYPVYPLCLDYVAGALTPDHQVRTLDLNQLPEGLDLESSIRAFAPDIVGISLRNIDNTDVLHPKGFMGHYHDLMKRVRRACDAPVVLGGSGFTIFPHETMNLLEADYGIVGEGERMALLLKALERGEAPSAVPGVITRGAPVTDPAPWSRGFIRKFEPQAAHLDFYLKNSGMLNLQTKRGCPFRCVYCSYPHIEGRVMRFAAPADIARTAVQLQQAGAKYIFVTDSAFNADIDHSLAVAQAFQKARLTVPWGAFFAPVRLPRDYFKTMADCGLKHVEFGTESLCAPVLKAYRKPFALEHVAQAHRAAVAAGL